MPTTEDGLRAAFKQQPAVAAPDAAGLLQVGRQRLQRRRLRRAGAALVVPLLLAGGVLGGDALSDRRSSTYLLAGSGLTLAAGSAGPVQVSGDRVDLGDGIHAWRRDRTLYIGYPARPYAALDTSDLTARWNDLGYDAVVFDDPGQHDGSTIVVGTVRGAPTSVRVGVDGVFARATIACFQQAEGWCSYKANVPTSIRSYDDPPQVQVR